MAWATPGITKALWNINGRYFHRMLSPAVEPNLIHFAAPGPDLPSWPFARSAGLSSIRCTVFTEWMKGIARSHASLVRLDPSERGTGRAPSHRGLATASAQEFSHIVSES